jgi:hypothetical protein
MSVYEQLKQKYPDKEIKMIPASYLSQYKKWGFTCVYSWTENSSITGEKLETIVLLLKPYNSGFFLLLENTMPLKRHRINF